MQKKDSFLSSIPHSSYHWFCTGFIAEQYWSKGGLEAEHQKN
jgi:hypothetical protein